MEDCIGLDVSMKETAVSIRREGKRVWRGRCASDPKVIAELVRKRAQAVISKPMPARFLTQRRVADGSMS